MTPIGTSAPRAGLLLPACLVILCMLMPSLSTAEVYKWVDNDGKTNYTQIPPPPGYEWEAVRETASPAATPAPPATVLQERFEEQQKDRENKAAVAGQEKKNAEIMQLNCDAATGNLEALELGGNRMYKTADGEYLRLSGEERQQRIDQAKQQMEKYCTK
jgi:Domain of unknown function (DUF4124)